ASADSLLALADTGGNAAAIVPTFYQDTGTSNAISAHPDRTISHDDFLTACRDAHAAGLQLVFKPHVDVLDGSSRTSLLPADPSAWFASYRSVVLSYFSAEFATLASEGIEFSLVVLGTELQKISHTHRDEWLACIATIRGYYAGHLAYAANANDDDLPREYETVCFWDSPEVAYIGVDAWFDLSFAAPGDDPDRAALVSAWEAICDPAQVGSLGHWLANSGLDKPLIFTEVGYRAIEQAQVYPNRWAGAAPVDEALQARCLDAMYDVVSRQDWCAGTFLWQWYFNPAETNVPGLDYSPQGRAAEDVVAFWNGALAPPPLALTAQPPLEEPQRLNEGDSLALSMASAGGVAPYTYSWTLDGSPAGNDTATLDFATSSGSVAHPLRERLVLVTCTVRDATGNPQRTVWPVTIVDIDRLPPAPVLTFAPSAPTTSDDIRVLITQAADPDGDAIAHTFAWSLLEHAERSAFADNPLPAANTRKGNLWRVQVHPLTTPYTTAAHSGPSTDAQVRVENTQPAAADVNQAASPGTPTTVQLLGSDPDSEPLEFEIVGVPANGALTWQDHEQGIISYRSVSDFAGTDEFTYVLRDQEGAVSAPATVRMDVDGWALIIGATGAQVDELRLGVHGDAHDGFDLGLDATAPAAPERAVARFVLGQLELRHDFRAETAEWVLEVDGGVTMSWDVNRVPKTGLFLREEPPIAREDTPVYLDMRHESQLYVPPGTRRVYRISQELVFGLELGRGWNLVSVPLAPQVPTVAAVFEGLSAWELVGLDYAVASDVRPGVGYWVFYPGAPRTLNITGTAASGETTTIAEGWNFVGILATPPYLARHYESALAPAAAAAPPFWWWTGTTFSAATVFQPGRGYAVWAELAP
ncbi:MAG: hypothetical protein ACI8W8_004496, partial [Rhodothermales bacterium]